MAEEKEVKNENESEQKQEAAQEKKEVQKRQKRVQSAKAEEEKLLFGKYPLSDVKIEDASLANYIILSPRIDTFGRRKDKAHYVMHTGIVERLINKLMRGGTGQKIGGKVIRTEGRLQGKKLTIVRTVEEAFDIVAEKTGKNPVQVLVDAIEYSAPIEDTTRIRYGGINYNVAVGITASRRLDVALRNIALAALIGAFKSRKTLAEALAEELIAASNNSSESYAIKKRVEMEHIARSAR